MSQKAPPQSPIQSAHLMAKSGWEKKYTTQTAPAAKVAPRKNQVSMEGMAPICSPIPPGASEGIGESGQFREVS